MSLRERVKILEKKIGQSACEHRWEIVKVVQFGPTIWEIHVKCWKCELLRKTPADKEAIQAIKLLIGKVKN